MANDLTFNQISAVMNEVVKQATGREYPSAIDTGSFVTQGQLALKAGYDPVLQSISQVLSNTIFSVRPYYRKLAGLEVDEIRWGNHQRKLTNCDSDFEDDARYELTDGESVDQYTVKKNKCLQFNFYGQEVFEFQSPTYFRDQLDVAFRSPEEFGRYITMVTQNATDVIEQGYESMARMLLANLIGGKFITQEDNPDGVVHLVTEYNAYAGTNLTPITVHAPENFKPFAQWAFGRIRTLRDMMTERNNMYQMNVDGYRINRHTPLDRQKIYLVADELNHIDASVLSNTYNDEYLRLGDHERLNFWQSPKMPYQVAVSPSYIDAQGNVVTGGEAVLINYVFGVIFDEEAIGYTRANQWIGTTPFNAKGAYYNEFYHSTGRWWTDLTEKAVVLMLD